MAVDPMKEFYKRLKEDYHLGDHHFWYHDKSKRHIIYHSAVELIQKQDGISTYSLKMNQEGTQDGAQHITWACIAWIPGEKQYVVEITKSDVNIYDPEYITTIKKPDDVIAEFVVKAENGRIYAETGEGDNTNFREGYKETIVKKRAFDRAILGLIQDKYEYMILTNQDAEIIDGQSELYGKPAKEPQPTKEDTDQNIEQKEYLRFEAEVKKWIQTLGPGPARKLIQSDSKTMPLLNESHKNNLIKMIENAEAIQKEINKEKEKSPQKDPQETEIKVESNGKETQLDNDIPPITSIELSGASDDSIETVRRLASELYSLTGAYKPRIWYSKHLEEVNGLPDGLKSYLRRIIAEKKGVESEQA